MCHLITPIPFLEIAFSLREGAQYFTKLIVTYENGWNFEAP